MGGGRLLLNIGGRWKVGLKNRWEVGLVGGGLSKMVGGGRLVPQTGGPPKQVGDARLRPLPHTHH